MQNAIHDITGPTRINHRTARAPHAEQQATKVRAPGALRLALEWRAPWELGAGLAALPLLSMAPTGDGHPVLVFPGLIASDASTGLLRRYLTSQNYAAHSWKLGRNLGPRPGVLEACERQVEHLSARYGRKVSLIGWSLGGIYARETAKKLPEHVRCVITLGTPFAGHPRATNAWRVYEMASGERVDDTPRDWPHLQGGAAGADHLDLQPQRRRSWPGSAACRSRARRRRTSRSTPATSASACIRPCSTPSPTGWRSRKATGSRSTAAACAGWSTAIRRRPTAVPQLLASC